MIAMMIIMIIIMLIMIFLKVSSDQILSTPGWPIIDHPALTRAECATEFRLRPQPSHQNTFQSQINGDNKKQGFWKSFGILLI